jgi:hypothetical protein
VGLATLVSGEPFTHDSGVVFGAGIGARLDPGRAAWRPALWILGEYHPPFGGDAQPVGVRTSVWSLRALPMLQLFDSTRVLVEAGAGGGVDIVSLSPGENAGGAHFASTPVEASPILTGALAAHLTLAPSFRVFVLATIDGDAKPRRYVVATGPEHTTISEPLAVRPGIAIGFAFDVAGSGGTP